MNLNSLLLESPSSLTTAHHQETSNIICQGIGIKNVCIDSRLVKVLRADIEWQPFVSDNSVLAAGKYLLFEDTASSQGSAKIIESLAMAIQPGGPVDSRRLALVVIKTISRKQYDLVKRQIHVLAPPIFASARDLVVPIKLAAEAAFMAIFSAVEHERAVFDTYLEAAGPELGPTVKRNMLDYFNRVTLRIAAQARERPEVEGGLGLSEDERDDERELWSVGKVDLGQGVFGDE